MSLPPSDMQAAPDKTARRFRFTKWDWVRVGVLTLVLSTVYLLIDIVLDPALLPHAARAGRLPVLLVLVGIGFFMGFSILVEMETKRSRVERTLNLISILLLGPMLPIWTIAWLDPYLPNMRYGVLGAVGLGVADIGFIPCVLSLLYGLLAARKRHETEEAYAERGIPAREQVVGFEPAVRALTVIWFLAVVTASIYGIWLALTLTNASDTTTLLVSFAILGGAFAVSTFIYFWLYLRTRRYAIQTGDTALLASTTLPNAARTRPERMVVPPDERPRWGVVILIGLGLFAFSLLTFAVLDFYYVQSTYLDGSQRWLISALIPLFSLMGLHRASARRYQLARLRRLLVAAAAFVVAGDAMWLDTTYPHHSIVPPLGLLVIAVLCSTVGVLICHSLLLKPMSQPQAELIATMPLVPTSLHEGGAGGSYRRPWVAPYLLFLLPVLIIVTHLIYYWGIAAPIEEWGTFALKLVPLSISLALATVVNADLPQRQPTPPIKKAQ